MRWSYVQALAALPLLLPPSTVLAQGKQPNPPALDRVKAIQMDLESKNPLIKKAALGGAGLLFQELRGMAKFVATMLEDPDEEVRYEAAKALEALGPLAGAEPDHFVLKPTALLLGKLLFDKSAKVREMAAQALGQMEEQTGPALPYLLKALKSEDVVIRRWAASLLSRKNLPAEETVPALLEGLDDPDRVNNPNESSVSQRAAVSLGLIGPRAKPAVPKLMNMLKNGNLSTRNSAAVALAKIDGKSDPKIVQALIAILQDPNDRDLHSNAALGLIYIGPPAKAAVPTLIELLDTQKVGQYKNPEAMLGNFVTALGVIGPEAKAAVPHLAKIVKDKSLPSSVRQNTVFSLTWIGPAAKEALPALMVPYLDPKSGINMGHLNKALLKIGGADAIPYLLEALKAERIFARLSAAEALGQLGRTDPAVIKALEEAERNDIETGVRQAATEALDLLLKRPKETKLPPA